MIGTGNSRHWGVGLVVGVALFQLLFFLILYSAPSQGTWETRKFGVEVVDRLIQIPQENLTRELQTQSSHPQSKGDYGADFVSFQKPSQKIVGFILAGRQELVRILDCYVQRNLVRNGGWLDEVIWVIRTDKEADIEYLNQLVESVPEYTSITSETSDIAFSTPYSICERDTIYIKIDDDVVFFEDHTIPAIVKRLLENPRYSVVSANVVNQPALTWIHYHLNAAKPYFPELTEPETYVEDEWQRWSNLNWRPSTMPHWEGPENFTFSDEDPVPFKGHRWLRLPDDANIEQTPMGSLGEAAKDQYDAWSKAWTSWTIASQIHYSFFENLENNELSRYKFDIWNYHYDRISINFLAFSGDLVIDNPIEGAVDEAFLTQVLPKRLNRPAILDGTGLAVHFGFYPQVYGHDGITGSVNSTDALARYQAYANEFICGKPIGSPRL